MTVVVPKTNRGPGLIDSGTANIAAVLGPVHADTNYILTALMDAADIADPTLSLHFTLALDGVVVRDEDWRCGTTDRNGAPLAPFFSYSTGSRIPTTTRVTATLPKVMQFGLDVSLGSTIR